jgi:ribose transport system ATP-binding protein
LPYALFGAERATGRLMLQDESVDLRSWHPHHAMERRLALVPGNRASLGAASDASATENVTLLTLRRFMSRLGWLQRREERRRVAALMNAYGVVPPEPVRRFGAFSGGNQQKLIIAKWLENEPAVLLLHEPAQGVDVGARRQILKRVREIADSGTPVVVASAEYEDLAQVCDRVLIFRHGRISGELAGHSLTHERILERLLREDHRAPSESSVTVASQAESNGSDLGR